jgi:hypothetical protein
VESLRAALDAALPPGLDIVEAVPAGPGSLAERMQAAVWHVELPGVPEDEAQAAVAAFLACPELGVERLTKEGRRTIDARTPVVSATVSGVGGDLVGPCRAILDLVVRQVTPAVRPDDVLAALRAVAGLALDAPPVAVRLAQGPIDDTGTVGDPLEADRIAAATSS